MPRPARVSPDRILAAAAAEFASRGFAGARVDRIARRARVNKAMIYYHFGSKQSLYRTLLRATFATAAARLGAVAAAAHPPARMIDEAIAAFATLAREQAFFPAVMLREIAEGGTHLDRDTLEALASVPAAFGRILGHGAHVGAFRPVHPIAAYFHVMAPLMLFMAAAPIRRQLSSARLLGPLTMLSPEAFVGYLQDATRRVLAAHSCPPEGLPS
ncbi:MAG: TetR/AcrR family transcriptional regulator [Vicinamibacterales bacterium]